MQEDRHQHGVTSQSGSKSYDSLEKTAPIFTNVAIDPEADEQRRRTEAIRITQRIAFALLSDASLIVCSTILIFEAIIVVGLAWTVPREATIYSVGNIELPDAEAILISVAAMLVSMANLIPVRRHQFKAGNFALIPNLFADVALLCWAHRLADARLNTLPFDCGQVSNQTMCLEIQFVQQRMSTAVTVCLIFLAIVHLALLALRFLLLLHCDPATSIFYESIDEECEDTRDVAVSWALHRDGTVTETLIEV